MSPAADVYTVKSLRASLTAFVLIASIFAGALGADGLAAGRHEGCPAQKHHCGECVRIATCNCCGHTQSTAETGTPAEARVELLRTGNAPVALPAVIDVVVLTAATAFEPASSPPPFLLDRPVVFGALLI